MTSPPQIENYIQLGDDIDVMYRSLALNGFRGMVVGVDPTLLSPGQSVSNLLQHLEAAFGHD
jgi:hypothetical protein